MLKIKKGSIALIAIIVAVLVIAAVAVFFLLKTPSEEIEKDPLDDYQNVLGMSEQELLQFKEKQISNCMDEFIDYQDLAFATLDKSNCKKADNEGECLEGVYGLKSIYEKNPNLCKKIQDGLTTEFCNSLHIKDISICQSLDDPDELTACSAILNRNGDLCNPIANQESRGECIFFAQTIKAIESNNQRVCDGISIVNGRNICKSILTQDTSLILAETRKICVENVDLTIASFSGEVPCEGIQDSNVIANCKTIGDLNKIKTGVTLETCNALVDTQIRNACVSVVNEDVGLCDAVTNKDALRLCAVEIGIQAFDHEICDSFTQPEARAVCASLYS